MGHLSLGYIIGKVSAKLLKSTINLPLLLTVSIIPDIDLLLSPILKHRTITHSINFYAILSLPFFVIYSKKTIPYFIALISHSLIGDMFSVGTQLFWPINEKWIYILHLPTNNQLSIALETSLFICCIAIMIITKDLQRLPTEKYNKIFWIIPLGAVLGPFILNKGVYTSLPDLLIIPSLIFASIFVYKIIFVSKQKTN